jgi:hypothetical protein
MSSVPTEGVQELGKTTTMRQWNVFTWRILRRGNLPSWRVDITCTTLPTAYGVATGRRSVFLFNFVRFLNEHSVNILSAPVCVISKWLRWDPPSVLFCGCSVAMRWYLSWFIYMYELSDFICITWITSSIILEGNRYSFIRTKKRAERLG